MAFQTAREVFEDFVPRRIAGDRELAASIGATYQIDVVGEGCWVLDFTGDEGKVREARVDDAACYITVDAGQVRGLMEDPMLGIKLLMTGELEIAGEYSLAEHLLKVFGPRAS